MTAAPALEPELKKNRFPAESENFLEKAPARKEPSEEENNTFTEVAPQVPASETLPFMATEVNSESFIRPQHNPAMDAYLKKAAKMQEKSVAQKDKPKQASFFRRVREKITLYLRKLTLKDIRFIDED